MSKVGQVKLSESAKEDFTKICFQPDLKKFKMPNLDKDIVDLMARRAYDIAASTGGVKVYLNEKRVPVSTKKSHSYCKLIIFFSLHR
jgi:DNA topoisomerase II